MAKMKKSTIKSILLWAGCGLAAASASAQRIYTLDECLEAAVANNVRMKNAGNDLRVAEQERKSAFTRYFPSVSATGGGFMANKGMLPLELAGMEASLMKNGLVGAVSAEMPIFTGGQIVNGNKLAKTNVEKYRLMHRQSENEVLLTTESYYWQVVVLKEKLRTLEVVEQQLSQMLSDVEASVEAGVTNRNDLLQVRLRQNETESSRISAENALKLSKSLLAQYIGAESDSVDVAPFSVADSIPENPEALYADPEASLPLTNEYNLLQANVEAKRIERNMTIGKNLPTVAIGGGYMYHDLTDKAHPFWIGFATVSVPISGWWGGSHDIKQQRLQVRSAENQLTDQSELLVIRMQSTWNDLYDAYRQVEIARNSIEQATENLRLNTDYYAAGTCTMSDLLEAQTLFRQSRDNYVDAYSQYEVKKREYLQATGR